MILLFGLHFGESLQLAALGIVGQIIQNSRTVGEALTHAAGFHPFADESFRYGGFSNRSILYDSVHSSTTIKRLNLLLHYVRCWICQWYLSSMKLMG